jgi:Sec-independent protein translocase protein TatA
VQWLTRNLNKSNIELIYTLIQKSGIKIRQNDPSVLKNIINTVKEAIEQYRKQCRDDEEQLQKIKFIENELNEIRFNKKEQNSLDQRMGFLETFLNKNVKKEIEKEEEVFPLDFQTLTTIDTSTTLWWEDLARKNSQH